MKAPSLPDNKLPSFMSAHTSELALGTNTIKRSANTGYPFRDDSPQLSSDPPQGVVVFDLETQKLADEVGGWKNIREMRLSLGVVHSEQDGFRTFTEENVSDLIQLLKKSDLIVGFNQMRFDYEVLAAYTEEDLRALPNLDILLVVQAKLGHRLSLDQLAAATLGEKKSGSGLQAAAWFKEGKMDLLEQYCRDDVRITRDLYLYGLEKGYLLYKPKGRAIARIPVDWGKTKT